MSCYKEKDICSHAHPHTRTHTRTHTGALCADTGVGALHTGASVSCVHAWMQARLPTPTLCIEYLCYHYAVVLALFNAITLCFKQKDDFVYNPNILQTQCFQCFAPCLL